MCVFRKDKEMLEDKLRSSNLEREQEQLDRIVKESGGKLTRRLANSQVTGLFLPTASWFGLSELSVFTLLVYFLSASAIAVFSTARREELIMYLFVNYIINLLSITGFFFLVKLMFSELGKWTPHTLSFQENTSCSSEVIFFRTLVLKPNGLIHDFGQVTPLLGLWFPPS